MRGINQQRGLGFFGVLIVLAVAGSLILFGLKVTPLYLESFQVDAALKNIVEQPDARKLSNHQIHDKFLRHMEINGIRRFSQKNLKDALKIERGEDGSLTITIKYQAQRELVGNLSILADWHKEYSI